MEVLLQSVFHAHASKDGWAPLWGDPRAYREYYADSSDVTWDGKSPLPLDLSRVIGAALAEASEQIEGDLRLERLDLEFTGDPAGDRHYYFIAVIETTDRPSPGAEILLDLRGRVIRPRVRWFADAEAYRNKVESRPPDRIYPAFDEPAKVKPPLTESCPG